MKTKTMVIIIKQKIEKDSIETMTETVGDDLWAVLEKDILEDVLEKINKARR